MNVAVASLGFGNAAAILRMYESIGVAAHLVGRPDELSGVTHLILPGVGHFAHAMSLLEESRWGEAIGNLSTQAGSRILGLCLGAQLLGQRSDEGDRAGLGLLPMETVRMRTELPVPNMGWRRVDYTTEFVDANPEFTDECYYFSHGYEMRAIKPECVVGTFDYDGPRIAVVSQGSVLACQFHPEKSHRFGKKLLGWFASL